VRILAVSTLGVLEADTGEIHTHPTLPILLTNGEGGIIVGNNLYPILAPLAKEIQSDEGWTMTISVQQQSVRPHDPDEKRKTGKIYINRLTYRAAKIREDGARRRPRAIKWVVIEIGLFIEQPPTGLQALVDIAKTFIDLADRRKINPRPSPGSFGSAMLRASPQWNAKGKRNPAPWFISKLARDHLPGNYYALSPKAGTANETIPSVYYVDQESSHHKIVNSTPMPDPSRLHARGALRRVENDIYPNWIEDVKQLTGHIGLLCCQVNIGFIPDSLRFMYPPWAHRSGTHIRWIWTPELRLFQNDHRIHLQHVSCALTSTRPDPALWEYSDFALEQIRRLGAKAKTVKPALLAAYGMLACKGDPISIYSVHGRKKPPKAEVISLPLLPRVYMSKLDRTNVPSTQNVIARGVIEAETRTRSIEYARQLEAEGLKVAQIYADGILVATDRMPLLLPEHWRIAAALTRVSSPHPNSIISKELIRLPGIQSSERDAYMRSMPAGRVRQAFRERLDDGRKDFAEIA
jgi:hypothetical protein